MLAQYLDFITSPRIWTLDVGICCGNASPALCRGISQSTEVNERQKKTSDDQTLGPFYHAVAAAAAAAAAVAAAAAAAAAAAIAFLGDW